MAKEAGKGGKQKHLCPTIDKGIFSTQFTGPEFRPADGVKGAQAAWLGYVRRVGRLRPMARRIQ
jgi:hypothetical protein